MISNDPDGIGVGNAMNKFGMNRNFLRSHLYESWEQNWATPAYAPMRAAIPYHKIDLPFEEGMKLAPADVPTITQYLPDIKTYVNEMTTKFMLGQASMDEWDEYVATVKKLGIDFVLEVRQKQANTFLEFAGDKYPW